MKAISHSSKVLFLLSATMMLVLGCATTYTPAPISNEAVQVNMTPTIAPTATQTPLPTIDFQMTAVIAQQTSDEARRVNAVITAQFEQRIQEQLQITAEAERRNQEVYSWTATAALTSIPLTATQQASLNTQIVQEQLIAAAILTSTVEAPTQIAAMAAAQNSVMFQKAKNVSSIAGNFGILIFCIGLLVFLFTHPWETKQAVAETSQAQPQPQTETVVQLKSDRGGGDFSLTRNVIPCSPEQLWELSENITQGKKTLAINNWEGKDTLFTRPVILRVRAWLREDREIPFVVVSDDGQLVPTNELLDFMCGWLDKQALPAGYEFEVPHSPETAVIPNHDATADKTLMNMVNHAKNNGGGGGNG